MYVEHMQYSCKPAIFIYCSTCCNNIHVMLLSSKTLKWVDVSIQSYMGIVVAN